MTDRVRAHVFAWVGVREKKRLDFNAAADKSAIKQSGVRLNG